ncbi:MAG TPA: MFS transporter [Bacilli bacterium]
MKIFCLYYFFYYLALASYYPYISLILDEKGIRLAQIGVILSVWAFVSVFSQPIMGLISDRLRDRRMVLIIATFISPIVAYGFYFSGRFTDLLVVAVLFSWFQSSTSPLSDALTIETCSQKGVTFGRIRLWGALSYAICTLVSGLVYKKIGYNRSFFVYFALSFIVFFILWFIPKQSSSRMRTTFFNQSKIVFFHKKFLMFSFACFLIMMSASINSSYLPIHFSEMGFDKGWIGAAFSVAAFIEVPMFWLSDRLNRRFGGSIMLRAAAILYAVKYLVFFLCHNVYLIIAAQLLDGVSFAFYASNSVEMVDDFSGSDNKASFQTIFASLTYGLGGIIGAAIGGIIIDLSSTTHLYFVLVLFCFSGFVLLSMKRLTSDSLPKKESFNG